MRRLHHAQTVLQYINTAMTYFSLISNLLQMVHADGELYSVTEMASLLFGNEDAVSCYASHRLLSQERMFFKQAGRKPPKFQARPPSEVNGLRAKKAAEEKASHCMHAICLAP